MLTCSNCQFANPVTHKFCQRCGEPLGPLAAAASPGPVPLLQARLAHSPPQRKPWAVHLGDKLVGRYQVVTVLSEDAVLVRDRTPEIKSPIQRQLSQLAQQPAAALPDARPKVEDLRQDLPEVPGVVHPYLRLAGAVVPLYDAWQQDEATVLVTDPEGFKSLMPLLEALAIAVDPLQPVYWFYRLSELWAALAPLPQWRASLLRANSLGIDRDQSLVVQAFGAPATDPPEFAALTAFLNSLLGNLQREAIAESPEFADIQVAVTSAPDLKQLQHNLTALGERFLEMPQRPASAPNSAAVPSSSPSDSHPAPSNVSPTVAAPIPVAAPETVQSVDRSLPSSPGGLLETMDNPNTDQATPLATSEAAASHLSADSLETPADSLEAELPGSFAEEAETEGGDEATMVLPMKLTALEDAGRTDVGRQRDHNEDCFFIESICQKRADNRGQSTQARCLYVLCDGMGGHAGGEVASQLAAQTLSQYFAQHWPQPAPGEAPAPLPDKETIVAGVKLANQAIFEINEKEARAGHERMGTTLVMVLLQGAEAAVAHVGDSRLYQYTRRGGLWQVTVDHEVGQREMQRGIPQEIAYARPDAYQLTQALGPRDSEDLEPDVTYLNFSANTLLLLCSDGLSDNNLVEDYLESHFVPLLQGRKELEQGVDDLIDLANQVNGHDNISAIALRLKVSPDLELTRSRPPVAPSKTVIQ